LPHLIRVGAYTANPSTGDSGQDRNLAEALVKRGIPAVLAMAERIPDEVALDFNSTTFTAPKLAYLDRPQPQPR
jgi:hypothetical protein